MGPMDLERVEAGLMRASSGLAPGIDQRGDLAGLALGPTMSQLSQSAAFSSVRGIGPSPSQGRAVRALRPVWPSCSPGVAPCARMNVASRAIGAM